MTTPREIAERVERDVKIPRGDGEILSGYLVMSAPFSSGHVLGMRRFPTSSIQKPYKSVWHRDPAGAWSIYTDVEPQFGCPRYFGAGLEHAEQAEVNFEWTGSHEFRVTVPKIGLEWTLRMRSTFMTTMMNMMGKTMLDPMWRSTAVLAGMGRMAGPSLRAGKMRLRGRTPNGQVFLANPFEIWEIGESSATINGQDLGTLAPLPQQDRLADFWVPQRALFGSIRAYFDELDPAVHYTGVQKASAVAAR